ncbi:DUF2714 domain-containing protein [Mesomycoplasma conjunctivae]|uniref:DUF2714 domain-containing protein n=1 Tax=Mesomycoplasma conjunctivae TaxID=45361 RepID=UPI003DA448CB
MKANLFKKRTITQDTTNNKKDFSDYYEIIKDNNFINFDSLANISLLASSLAHDSAFVEKYKQKALESFKANRELVYKNFVVSWSKSSRFGSTKLAPIVIQQESSNIRANNFFSDDNQHFNLFLNNLNILSWEYIEKGKYVEVTEGIIIFRDPQTRNIKVAFSEISMTNQSN